MDFQDFDIWLLPNDSPTHDWGERLRQLSLGDRIHIEPTGPANPGTKRNVAMRKSPSKIFALIDSDAYPRADWLANALPLLSDEVAIVAGPNMTPPDEALRRRVSGHVMASPLGFGPAYIRHRPVPRQTVNEMPTCNMVLRQPEDLYFRESLDTAEDMVFCEETRCRGLKILYDPDVVVFHHRRQAYLPFFRQFFLYGLYKGRITRLGRSVGYLWQSFPALLVIHLLVSTFWWTLPLPGWLLGLGYAPLLVYLAVIGRESVNASKPLRERLMTVAGFVTGHVGYGMGYLRGLFWPLADEEELRSAGECRRTARQLWPPRTKAPPNTPRQTPGG